MATSGQDEEGGSGRLVYSFYLRPDINRAIVLTLGMLQIRKTIWKAFMFHTKSDEVMQWDDVIVLISVISKTKPTLPRCKYVFRFLLFLLCLGYLSKPFKCHTN